MPNTLNFSESVSWWAKGLGYLCPDFLRQAISAVPDSITIEFKEQQVLLKHYKSGSEDAFEIKQFSVNDEIERVAIIAWLEEQTQNGVDIILVIPDDLFLKKKMAFPRAARPNLRQVLSFEMNRKTPFNPEQVYFDYSIDEEDVAAVKLQIELNIVPKNRVDPNLETLKSWGIKLDAIRPLAQYANPDVNLIPPEDQPQDHNASDKPLLFLATVTFLLFIAFLYVPILGQQKQLTLLESEVAKSRKSAIQLQTLQENKQKLLEQSHFLEKKRNSEMNSINLIHEVTQIIPDDTWLTRFVMKSGELQLQGESSNASSLIQILETSQYFTNAQFRSPVTQNRVSNKDKFHLSAKFMQEES